MRGLKMVRRLVLLGLSCLYSVLSRTRNLFYEVGILPTHAVGLPVLSVGNLSAGGNAKTPLCMFIAVELARRGLRPVVLSRGYGGRSRSPRQVTAADNPDLVGDEPVLMVRYFDSLQFDIPVVVARNRVKGARWIERQAMGGVIILDDGFQHRRLQRSLDVLSVNVDSEAAVQDFLDGFLLPLGRFRERRDAALQRADILIFSERRYRRNQKALDRRLFKVLPQELQLFRSFVEPEGLVGLLDGAQLPQQAVVAFCAIANPDGFFATLTEMGCELVAGEVFRDHYQFRAQDLERLRSAYPKLPLVCTEKDAVKLQGLDLAGVYVLKIKTTVSPADAFVVQLQRLMLDRLRSDPRTAEMGRVDNVQGNGR